MSSQRSIALARRLRRSVVRSAAFGVCLCCFGNESGMWLFLSVTVNPSFLRMMPFGMGTCQLHSCSFLLPCVCRFLLSDCGNSLIVGDFVVPRKWRNLRFSRV